MSEPLQKDRKEFAVIYRGYLKLGKEKEYQIAWQIVAEYFINHCGAIGSCLHCASDGMWLAYSRWPDQETRDKVWLNEESNSEKLPQHILNCIEQIQGCLDPEKKLPDICMEVVNDLLLTPSIRANLIIQPFTSKYQTQVVDLIERIQIGEFNLPIDENQRCELQSISHSFQINKGNYWIALLDDQVIGTIAVQDIGHQAFELRDVFLEQKYRGAKTGVAKKLLETVFEWAKTHDIRTIFLGTTLRFKAAHRFYEKHGFIEIARKDMPSYCQPMECDEKFYRIDLFKK